MAAKHTVKQISLKKIALYIRVAGHAGRSSCASEYWYRERRAASDEVIAPEAVATMI
jgi:hypothetical protein